MYSEQAEHGAQDLILPLSPSGPSTCYLPSTRSLRYLESPKTRSLSSPPTPSHCSGCGRCSSWSRGCSTDWSPVTGAVDHPGLHRRQAILHWAHVDIDPRVPAIPTLVSLVVILIILAVVTVASLIKTGRDPSARAHAGAVLGSTEHTGRTAKNPSRGHNAKNAVTMVESED